MATTRRRLRQLIQLNYNNFISKNGGNDTVDERIIDIYINQSINKLLKVQVQENLKRGSYEIPSCSIVTYTRTPTSNVITLPIVPLSLPLDMGVWAVGPVGSDEKYIPIPKAFSNVYAGTNVEYLEGQIGYVVRSNKIHFKSDVTTPVEIDLLVSDFDTTGEDDLLPISPDIEGLIVSDVLDTISQGRFSQTELTSKDSKVNAN